MLNSCSYRIESISDNNINELTSMEIMLWPDNKFDEMQSETYEIMNSDKETSFLYIFENEYAGFINMSLRNDYVEGTKTSPVGYIEGIFVKEKYRDNGIARALVEAGEKWAKSKGCTQLASDCGLKNKVSFDFHKAINFDEANRIICFVKNIE